MSLSAKLTGAAKTKANRGCQSCLWYGELSEEDKKAFDDWLANGWSLRQLYMICSTDPDHPLPVSMTALRNHVQDCLGGR